MAQPDEQPQGKPSEKEPIKPPTQGNDQSTVRSSASENLLAELYTGSAEKTVKRSPMDYESFQSPYNPDDLYRKRGDYRIYEEMCQDDQIAICLDVKKDLILGAGYEFVAQEEGQEEIIESLEAAFTEKIETPFIEACEEILTAQEFGFSISEKTFDIEVQLYIKSVKTRNPNTWLIYQDDAGNVEKYVQRQVGGDKEIPREALVHLVNRRRFQNPYGRSDLRVAYNAWFAKRQVIRFYAIYMESAAKPIPIARYDKNAPATAIAKIFAALKNFQTKTALTIPKEIEVEFLEAKTTGDAYIKALNFFNMCIGRALFIPDLMGFQGSETGGGSYALGKDQIGIGAMHITRRRTQLENLVQDHFVKPIVLFNFGEVKNIPQFRFKSIDDAKMIELAKSWLEAVKSKVWKPSDEEVNHFRKLVKFPEGEVDREAPVALGPDGRPLPPGPGGLPPKPGEEPPEPGEDGDMPPKPGEEKPAPSGEKKAFAKVYDFPPGDYHKKVDFKAIETKLNDYDTSVTNDVAPVIRKQLTALADQIKAKKIIQNGDVSKIDQLEIKYKKELNQVIRASFRDLWKDAQGQAAQELFKSDFAKKPLPNEDFMGVLENETFNYVGDYEYQLLKRTRAELVAGIKDGKPISAILSTLGDDLGKLAQTSVDRYARTKHTEVMNKARKEFFDSSGVVTGYQYSAILDDRTSDICRGLNGKKFKAADAPIPPMHFNCRSVLIPITKYEEFEPSESVGKQPIDDFIEENKGSGFPVK